MSFCETCSSSIPKAALFCPYCGMRLDSQRPPLQVTTRTTPQQRPVGITILVMAMIVSDLVVLATNEVWIVGIVIDGAIAYGLLTGKSWALIGVQILEVLWIGVALLSLPHGLISLILSITVLYYLNQPHVKNYFTSKRNRKI